MTAAKTRMSVTFPVGMTHQISMVYEQGSPPSFVIHTPTGSIEMTVVDIVRLRDNLNRLFSMFEDYADDSDLDKS